MELQVSWAMRRGRRDIREHGQKRAEGIAVCANGEMRMAARSDDSRQRREGGQEQRAGSASLTGAECELVVVAELCFRTAHHRSGRAQARQAQRCGE